jgi:hypothetical protein
MHLYWEIEASNTGRLTVPGGAIAAGGRLGGGTWVTYAGVLCVMGVLVALLRFRGEEMGRRTQLAVVGAACTAMTAYVVYAFTANGFQWLIAPGVLCAAAAVIALALIQPWGRVIPRRLLLLLAWFGGVLLILKTLYGASVQVLAVVGVITWQRMQILIGAPASQAPTAQESVQATLWNFLVWNLWFLLGGVLFCVLAWLSHLNKLPLLLRSSKAVYISAWPNRQTGKEKKSCRNCCAPAHPRIRRKSERSTNWPEVVTLPATGYSAPRSSL